MCRDFFCVMEPLRVSSTWRGAIAFLWAGFQSHGLSPRLLHKPAASPGLRRGHALSCFAAPGATCGVSLRSPVSPAFITPNSIQLSENQVIIQNL